MNRALLESIVRPCWVGLLPGALKSKPMGSGAGSQATSGSTAGVKSVCLLSKV